MKYVHITPTTTVISPHKVCLHIPREAISWDSPLWPEEITQDDIDRMTEALVGTR